jgi:phosphatidate cytidylyltransferase
LLIAVVLIVVLFAMPPMAAQTMISLVVLVGAWEWAKLLPAGSLLRVALPVALLALLLFWWWWPPDAAAIRRVLLLAAVWWVFAMLWIIAAPTRGHPWLTFLAALLSLAPLWIAVSALRGSDMQGARVLLLALVVVVAADTGAYFTGRALGRIKLAPRVSPGKTWEGVFGGVATSLIVAWVGARFLSWPIAPFLGLALAAAAFSVVGDLLESKMKRQAGVKDSGHLFPGHGGVLDRIDSLSAGLPVLALGLGQSGWLP